MEGNVMVAAGWRAPRIAQRISQGLRFPHVHSKIKMLVATSYRWPCLAAISRPGNGEQLGGAFVKVHQHYQERFLSLTFSLTRP
jgi:hypothetical protein